MGVQRSALSPLMFEIVIEEAIKLCRHGDPWVLLYTDDLMLAPDSQQKVKERSNSWRNAIARRGMKTYIPETKLLISSKTLTARTSWTGRWPCDIWVRGVGVNSILWTMVGATSFDTWTNFVKNRVPIENVHLSNTCCGNCDFHWTNTRVKTYFQIVR